MSKIVVTSDSTCALSRAEANKIGLSILPLNVIVNGVEYHDGIDIDLDQLCKMMRDGADIKTSTPTPYEIETFFDTIFAQGADHIIHFTISHKLSSMFDLFTKVCKEKYGDKVTIIDSLAVCVYMLNHVYSARNIIARGGTVEEVKQAIAERVGKENLVFIPESLTFLKRGGRVSPAVAVIGNLIGMKPELRFEDGGLEKEGTTRNTKKTLEELIKGYVAKNADPEKWEIDVIECDTAQSLLDFATECCHKYMPGFDVNITPLSINVCAHAGPGTIGIGLTPKPNK